MERVGYGTTKDGKNVDCFIIRNKNGVEVRCINYGCAITNIFLPNAQQGKPPVDVVLGYDNLSGYENDEGAYHGRCVGRYANRIKGARFALNGEEYSLMKNDGENYLHGTLHQKVFDADIIGENSVSFSYVSPDGEEGFPGEVWVNVTYTLTDKNELFIGYRGRSTKNTHLNLTNHTYYNLAGGGSIENQLLTLNCSRFLEIGEGLIPTGRIMETDGGAFDFSVEKPLGQDIDKADPQIKLGGGYDHCFILDSFLAGQPGFAAQLKDPESGRTMRLYTTQPGVQVYTGNFLGGDKGKNGVPLEKRTGVCLETQHFPDTPNSENPNFPPTYLRAGEKYHQGAILKFSF